MGFGRAGNGGFSVCAGSQELADLVRRSNSLAVQFAEDALVVTGDAEDTTPCTAIYTSYRGWAADRGLAGAEKRNQEKFMQDLEAAFPGVKRGQTHKGLRVLRGIKGFSQE